MNSDATLREILDRLVAGRPVDPAVALRADGTDAGGTDADGTDSDARLPLDLPADLFGQLLVSYCDTAPIEIAAHLEPYVTAVTAAADPDPSDGLELLASAPVDATIAIDPDQWVDAGEIAVDLGGPDVVGGDVIRADVIGDDFDFGTGGHDAVAALDDDGVIADHQAYADGISAADPWSAAFGPEVDHADADHAFVDHVDAEYAGGDGYVGETGHDAGGEHTSPDDGSDDDGDTLWGA